MEAYGRYAVVTEESAIHSIRKKIKYGRPLAIIIVLGVVAAQWTALSGLLGLTAIAALIGLTVTILGANPIIAQIVTQLAGVFVLPFIIAVIIVLINNQTDMGMHKAGIFLNTGLVLAFIFACFIA